MDYLLPATVYQPPPRPDRGRQLNTIVEDNEDTIHSLMSESDGTASDDTIIGRPDAIDPRKYLSQHRSNNYRTIQVTRRGPPSVVSSDCDDDDESLQSSAHSSYAGSESGTVFSESCPSLTGSHASEATTFATESNRSSIISRHSRVQLPSLIIPRNSWHSFDTDIKQISFGMSPATKVRLSPHALNLLPRNIPSIDAPPSLADTGSVRSTSPSPHAINSAPPTPDLHNIELEDGQAWGQPTGHLSLNTSLEIAIDEEHSILLSSTEAHSTPYSASHTALTARSSANWNELVRQFPAIPGATPTELTPITPNILKCQGFPSPTNQSGVQLPERAFEMLENLNRQPYDEFADAQESHAQEEMKECAVPKSRRNSWDLKSVASEYSVSALSIPSPGGFFASLQTGTRNTWSAPRKATPPPPSSTTAENFYRTPWNQNSVRPESVKETILECGDDADGPPTVTQATFNLAKPIQEEDADLYGSSRAPSLVSEYDETYTNDVKQKAGENIGRTSDWLADQNNFLAALRDADSISDLAPTSPVSETTRIAESEELVARQNLKAVHFLAEAKAAVSPTKETMFLEAFKHQSSETKRGDVFLHASSRLDTVQSSRITLPKRHVQALLNTCTSKTLDTDHARPKYRGPFSQNPRSTGDFTRTVEQAIFSTLERQQNALNAIKPNLWTLEAQRTILYNGRLMANRSASERLTKMDNDVAEAGPLDRPNKRRPRILDLAGAATASWAWAAATKWPNIMVYTVQTKQQAELARNYPATQSEDDESFRPETPKNHKVCSVPSLWQLPFQDNYFDVISARTLYMHLRANPVATVKSIDEWDMTLKECMRVLKPGGILDFFVMDSGISNDTSTVSNVVNLSPSNVVSSSAALDTKRKGVAVELTSELERRGYETDGGCRRLMGRLKQEGFVSVKRQWIGLPMGHSQQESNAARMHQRNTSTVSATSQQINQPQLDSNSRKPAFLPAPRPISEVSTISRVIDQYADFEAVRGPIGSTTDVADISALLGELLWEEWLVRLRIESGHHTPDTILDGVEEQFSEWRRSGKAAWRGVIGWARKPTRKEIANAAHTSVTSIVSNTSSALSSTSTIHSSHGFAIETPLATPNCVPETTQSTPVGLKRRSHVRSSRRMSGFAVSAALAINTDVAPQNFSRATRIMNDDYSMSAWERGEVGDIPVFMMG